MKLRDFNSVSYDLDIHLLGTHNCNVIGDYGGFMSIPSKYDDFNVIYMSVENNTLILQIDDQKTRIL